MKKIFCLFSISCFLLFNALMTVAQTFSSGGGSIPDDGNSIRFTLPVSGLPVSIDSTFGLKGVSINIMHPYVSDLDVLLIAPDSTYIELTTGNGGAGNNYLGTFFAPLS